MMELPEVKGADRSYHTPLTPLEVTRSRCHAHAWRRPGRLPAQLQKPLIACPSALAGRPLLTRTGGLRARRHQRPQRDFADTQARRFGQCLIERAGRTPSAAVKTRQAAIGMAKRTQGRRDPFNGRFMFCIGFAPGIGQGAGKAARSRRRSAGVHGVRVRSSAEILKA